MTRNSPGAPLTVRLRGYRSLLDPLVAAPLDRPFVTMWHPGGETEHETLTFGQFLDLARSFAVLLEANNLRAGETVVIIMPQGVPLMAAFVGGLLIGAIPTILAYPTFKIEPSKYRFGLSGVTANLKAPLVVVDADFPGELLEHLDATRTTRVVRVGEGNLGAGTEGPRWAEPHPDAVAFIQHSAGTTGLQKGVALPHRSVLNQLAHLAEALELHGEDSIVSWLPLYHDMGLIACFVLPLACHLHVVMESPTDWVLRPGSMLQLASRFRCTLCWLPNFAFQFMARRVPEEERNGLDLTSLRALINCSEPVSLASFEEFQEAYAPHGLRRTALQSSYAMAENTFAVTQSDLGRPPVSVRADRELFLRDRKVDCRCAGADGAVTFVSSGPCLPSNAVRIVGEDGEEMADGGVGEILVRSDSLFQGYYGRPDLSRKALRDGWYRTGDLGFLLDGELFVTGRKDDVIIVGGKNLYPQDIEAIVTSHPSVHDGRAVAFGLYNPELGTQELVAVAEVNRESDLDQRDGIEAEIRRAILAEIGVAPRAVHLMPPMWMVKSTAGKPARSTNRLKFLREHPELASDEEARNGKP